ncbi:hypothetical protein KOI40_10270 [Aestuariicella sp. G3-2]|uniref:hypothetical protein n=1 Tax=Pseudomaricurvus albidus TaxID=2842452 RepID=UPI001C0D8B7D|nr:hypothetical protein [Aestuariicella albida]MBU3070207.1 hypothetical protein [Aestuariicella albida]
MWIIDFEASGLTKSSYPIEVGVTNGSLEYQALIRPYEHWTHWSEEAEATHHISRDSLLSEGLDPDHIAFELNNLLVDQTVYCDSVYWDNFWCNALFSDCGMSRSFKLLDIQELVLNSDSVLEAFLDHKRKLESSGNFVLHRALDDARVIHESITLALANRQIE